MDFSDLCECSMAQTMKKNDLFRVVEFKQPAHNSLPGNHEIYSLSGFFINF